MSAAKPATVMENRLCDECGKLLTPKQNRYYCLQCPNYDTCEGCDLKHDPTHRMLLYQQPEETKQTIQVNWTAEALAPLVEKEPQKTKLSVLASIRETLQQCSNTMNTMKASPPSLAPSPPTLSTLPQFPPEIAGFGLEPAVTFR